MVMGGEKNNGPSSNGVYELSDLEQLEIGPELHRSNENVCFYGKFKDQAVVIKRLILNRVDSLDKFEEEVQILVRPDMAQHVCAPLAIVRAPPHYSIILPMMEHGSVNNILQRCELPIELILCFALDSSKALEAIHDAEYIHRDVKSANVLVDKSWVACLTDLGSAEPADINAKQFSEQMQPSGGFHKRNQDGTTLGYAAPEIHRNQRATKASDVYALAMTFAEMLTGVPPYHGMEKENPDLHTVMDSSYSEHALIKAITNDKLRPGLVTVSERPDVPIEFITLIREMWDDSMDARPSAAECVERLIKIMSKLGIDGSHGSQRQTYARSIRELRTASVDANDALLQPNNGGASNAALDVANVPVEMELDESDASDVGRLVKFNPDIPFGAFATSGRRGADKMEDRHAVKHFSLGGNTVLSVVTVFDGHGGAACAHFANQNLSDKLGRSLACVPFPSQDERSERITKDFVETDLGFRNGPTADKSGCTALAAALWKPNKATNPDLVRIMIANAGDCRAVLCRSVNGQDQAIRLSRDHNAASPTEQDRIRAAGGNIQVTRDGKYRVQGHIQVTRAIGDAAMKPYGVTAEPEILEYDLDVSQGDEFVIFATDGVWDTLKDMDAVQAVRNTAKECGLVAKRIGGDALNLGSTDNISVVVCFLRNFDQHEDVVYVR